MNPGPQDPYLLRQWESTGHGSPEQSSSSSSPLDEVGSMSLEGKLPNIGAGVGAKDGRCVGLLEGREVGRGEGDAVTGRPAGPWGPSPRALSRTAIAFFTGISVGFSVGILVGLSVGLLVGRFETGKSVLAGFDGDPFPPPGFFPPLGFLKPPGFLFVDGPRFLFVDGRIVVSGGAVGDSVTSINLSGAGMSVYGAGLSSGPLGGSGIGCGEGREDGSGVKHSFVHIALSLQ